MKTETKNILGAVIAITAIIGIAAIVVSNSNKNGKKPVASSAHEKMCRERFPAHYTDEIQACIEGRTRLQNPNLAKPLKDVSDVLPADIT